MSGFVTTPLLITEYYGSVISQLDIYTEETIKEYKENSLPEKRIINSNRIYDDDEEMFRLKRKYNRYSINRTEP